MDEACLSWTFLRDMELWQEVTQIIAPREVIVNSIALTKLTYEEGCVGGGQTCNN